MFTCWTVVSGERYQRLETQHTSFTEEIEHYRELFSLHMGRREALPTRYWSNELEIMDDSHSTN